MGKLRHIALYADDIEATARFYERAFGLARVRQVDGVIALSDGVMSLAIADAKRNAKGGKGLDHIGFLIDDMDAAAAKLEEAGGVHCGQIVRKDANAAVERKYQDPAGMMFDIATPEHARAVWGIEV
jgi:catechol 2,3-dioxygenase-like lactoylglutathione lyase family enzyme